MKNPYENLTQLRRAIYLWILPFFLLTILFSLVIGYRLGQINKDMLVLTVPLFIWFTICWFLLYKRHFMSLIEYINLFFIGFYHLLVFNGSIVSQMIPGNDYDFGVFIVWLPLYFIVIFITLSNWQRLFFSAGFIGITICIALYYRVDLPAEAFPSIIQYIVAEVVYVIVLYFIQYVLKAFVEREILYKGAYTDALTGIANRLQFNDWMEKQITIAKKQNTTFSIIFIDIDHFKKINDTYGHTVGDLVLIEFANTVKGALSDIDSFARWGGEEFIILTNRGRKEAFEFAEQLRKRVEIHSFTTVNYVTASFGVTEFHQGESFDSLLNRADKGLYLSKQNGRNQVCQMD
ncbi:sensor domain-containing diguanylate cyclase [Bacillus sp. REN16]|uniref:GGDEF domain-containing protein n=1 Tax=Bacillus sp. REN16 TaxID=2887296 RepID=UPI001E4B0855|nr:GGDEF domain-containing protein [Bacillus sp. REN16]MCC3358811.1 GGDEF domain-containing protein [Bacillus sp. REN16]